MGLRSPKPDDQLGEDQGASFGSEGWPSVVGPFDVKNRCGI